MKTKVLSLIRNSDTYVSGQELCEKLGVSRTAIWKVIHQLQEEGYEIEAIQSKGYKITHYPDLVTESEIASRLTTEWAGRHLYCLKVTGSTNIDAKRLAEEGTPHGTLVVAEMQNLGRGRRGKSWTTTEGTMVAMTILLRPKFKPDKASMLTLVMALAVAKAIEDAAKIPCNIKWPNDIVINGKKICGILTEMSAEMDYIHNVVIGAGINANLRDIPEELQETATSLLLETGHPVQRAELIDKTMTYFEQFYNIFLKTEDFTELREQYHAHLINKDKEVKVLDPMGEYIGVARGINMQGELLVQKEDGTIVPIYAGEVSVRGIYGYS